MNQFWKLVTDARWQEDLNVLEQARALHDQMVRDENAKYSEIVDEIDRVNREDQPEVNEMARIYLNSLNYDLTAIKRDQARRLENLEGTKKTIELINSWDEQIKA